MSERDDELGRLRRTVSAQGRRLEELDDLLTKMKDDLKDIYQLATVATIAAEIMVAKLDPDGWEKAAKQVGTKSGEDLDSAFNRLLSNRGAATIQAMQEEAQSSDED